MIEIDRYDDRKVEAMTERHTPLERALEHEDGRREAMRDARSERERMAESEARQREARERDREAERQRRAASKKSAAKRAFIRHGGREEDFEQFYASQIADEARRGIEADRRQAEDTIKRAF